MLKQFGIFFCILFIILFIYVNKQYPALSNFITSPNISNIHKLNGDVIIDIPNNERTAHSSSIVDLGTKAMILYFAGSKEGASDVKIYSVFLDKKTLTLSPPKVLLDAPTLSKYANKFIKKLGNPLVFKNSRGGVELFVVGVSLGGWATSKIYHFNFNQTLDKVVYKGELRLGILANLSHLIRTPALLLKNGGFILPYYYELATKYPLVAFFDSNSNYLYSKRLNSLKNQLQPSLIAISDTKCLAFFRNHKVYNNASFLQECSNTAQTWGEPYISNLKGYDDSVLLLTYRFNNKDRILLLYNDAKKLGMNNTRASLGLYYLKDKGDFVYIKNIDKVSGEYPTEVSYPSAFIDSKEGFLYVAYTYNRAHIRVQRINLIDIENAINELK